MAVWKDLCPKQTNICPLSLEPHGVDTPRSKIIKREARKHQGQLLPAFHAGTRETSPGVYNKKVVHKVTQKWFQSNLKNFFNKPQEVFEYSRRKTKDG